MNPPNHLDGILTTGGFSILGKIMPVGYNGRSGWIHLPAVFPRVQPTCRSWGPLIVVAWLASIGFHDLYIDYEDFHCGLGPSNICCDMSRSILLDDLGS